ncbi:MAG: NAD+ synthase [Burkholderiaceae bacterium]|jgi:NAD+ synthase (glutamine-hydrolysing)|nr:NAD+ synthase [Burkholderiaceae bacterium]
MRIALAQLNQTVGDFDGNVERIVAAAHAAAAAQADALLTPELALTGYPAEDLLLRRTFYEHCDRALEQVRERTSGLPLTLIVGAPVLDAGHRRNSAIVLREGHVIGRYDKQELPNYDVFDERRYFEPGSAPLVLDIAGVRCGILICEDFWFTRAATQARDAGARMLLALNASPYHVNKQALRIDVARRNVTASGMPIAAANLVGGQDELVFDGLSFALDVHGEIAAQALPFEEDLLLVDVVPGEQAVHVEPARIELGLPLEPQIYRALVVGLRDYVEKNRIPSVVLGLSGGIDSALVLAIAVDAFGPERVRVVMMPSPYTADISIADAREMAGRLGVRYGELPIGPAFDALRETLAPEFEGLPEDLTEENLQARIRGNLLMALSNKFGSIVLTTGNKSETAVGYSTLYGDMAGGFAVIKDVAKTMVYRLARWRNRDGEVIPERIITRAPSAELRAGQTDQDSLPPYDVLDGIMEMYVEENRSMAEIIAAGYPRDAVERVLGLIRFNEYKRRQGPVGTRITRRAFGRDWRQPITSRFRG